MVATIVTIGAYGFKEASFYEALTNARVDTFCDVRARRGLRGPEYAFANSQRLQLQLKALAIRYRHFPGLAPSAQLRRFQDHADHLAGIPRRQRTWLTPEFISGYTRECLDRFQKDTFLQEIGPGATVVALFCVESEASACHRSLLAERLARLLLVKVLHLMPS